MSAPIGGFVFALEIVGTYFSMRSYLKIFYVAVMSAYTARFFHALVGLNLNLEMNWSFNLLFPSFSIPELIAFVILAVIMSFVGLLFTQVNAKLLKIRDRLGYHYLFFKSKRLAKYKIMKIFENRVLWTVVICIVTSIVTFPSYFKYNSLSVGGTLQELMAPTALTSENGITGKWITNHHSEVFISLSIFIAIRFIVSLFAVTLPLPGGVYIPLLVIGAGCGRFFGELMVLIFPNGIVSGQPIYAGAYAMVGAVAMTASSTQTFTTVLFFLEMSGIGVYYPCILAAVISMAISKKLYYSLYDSIIKIKGFPALLETGTDSDDLLVSNLMVPFEKLVVLEETMSKQYIQDLLYGKDKLAKMLPVVNNMKDLILIGQVSVDSLVKQVMDTTQIDLNEKPQNETIDIDFEGCPVTLSENQSVQAAHLMFSQLGMKDVYVTWKGKLLGHLHRESLIAQFDRKNMHVSRAYMGTMF